MAAASARESEHGKMLHPRSRRESKSRTGILRGAGVSAVVGSLSGRTGRGTARAQHSGPGSGRWRCALVPAGRRTREEPDLEGSPVAWVPRVVSERSFAEPECERDVAVGANADVSSTTVQSGACRIPWRSDSHGAGVCCTVLCCCTGSARSTKCL
jgi:hypothetical protein